MDIRQETKQDHDKIYKFIKAAFETADVSNGKEQDFVNELRNSDNYIHELSLVAEQNGQIAGHIMLSKTTVNNNNMVFEVLLLAPLCVDEKYRGKGIGYKLVSYAIEKAKIMGYKAIFLAGNPQYYTRFGFIPALNYGIKCTIDIPEELLPNIMALELFPNALNGVVGKVNLGS